MFITRRSGGLHWTWAAATGLAISLGALAASAEAPVADAGLLRDAQGSIMQGDATAKRVSLCFSGGSESQLTPLLDALKQHGLTASFFVTADELGQPKVAGLVKRAIAEGHLVGPRGDDHLLESRKALREVGATPADATAFALSARDAELQRERQEALRRDENIEFVVATEGAFLEADPSDRTSNGALFNLSLNPTGGATAIDQVISKCTALASLGYEFVRVDQLCATAMRPIPRDPRYPPHWWTPVSSEGAPSWEILPQAAGPGEVILSKRHELGLLSNFAATPFTLRGKKYASVEGFWQMMKFPEGADDPRATFAGLVWPHSREQVAAMTAFEANAAGDIGSKNMAKMGIDWVSFEGQHFPYRPAAPGEHYRLIVEAMRAKLDQNPKVKHVLLSTGDLVLKPDHHQEENAPAAWRYFDIWMEIRAELQQKTEQSHARK